MCSTLFQNKNQLMEMCRKREVKRIELRKYKVDIQSRIKASFLLQLPCFTATVYSGHFYIFLPSCTLSFCLAHFRCSKGDQPTDAASRPAYMSCRLVFAFTSWEISSLHFSMQSSTEGADWSIE